MTSDAQLSPDSIPAQAGEDILPPIFPTLPVRMGDYKLTHLLGSRAYSDFYVARQSHVERRVVLEVMRPSAGDREERLRFLSHARSRVASQLPHTVQVLESATSPEGYCYISQNLPEGTTLAALAAEGRQLTVKQACNLISAAGELYDACTNGGLAAAPLPACTIFMTRAGNFTFLSPVLADSPSEADSTPQIQSLATAIIPLQPRNVPGQTRIATLLTWMMEGYEGQMLEWSAVSSTAMLIAEQLRPDSRLQLSQPKNYDKEREQRASQRQRKRKLRRLILLVLVIFTIVTMGGIGVLLAPEQAEVYPAVRGGYAYCVEDDKETRVTAYPVSIGEYHDFLIHYPNLDASRRGSITTGIPPAETDPYPSDWENMVSAAQQGTAWQGHPISLDTPVTNVSYWQALMYSRYLRTSMPGAALLQAVRDHTGLPGIEEWTQDIRPEALPYTKAYLVLPASDGQSIIPENNPSFRSPQRGFRICR